MVEQPSIVDADLRRLSQKLSDLHAQLLGFNKALKVDDLSSADMALESLNQQIAALRAEWRALIGSP